MRALLIFDGRLNCYLRATKTVVQKHDSQLLRALLDGCLTVTYNAIQYGRDNEISNRKGMKGFYATLKGTNLPSCYKVATITRACAILRSRAKSERRGIAVRHPKPLRPMICIISGFFITAKGRLFVPLARDRYEDILLNRHVQSVLRNVAVRSLTVTSGSLSICYSKETRPVDIRSVYGVDRNEKNLTFGNLEKVIQIDLSRAVRIRRATRRMVKSFRRNDFRIRKIIASKYWKRASNRTSQMMHAATNFAVRSAVENHAALALEDLGGIRRMYHRGRSQGRDYRFRLNSWAYGRTHRMLEYKAGWYGVTFIRLTKAETRGSSTSHHACGERLRSPERSDVAHRRMLWCEACNVWVDRDVNAALNLSKRGLTRLASSLPQQVARELLTGEKGEAREAVRGNETATPILRVDASKSGVRAHYPST